ncbi:alpha-D-ribose 1-methylphosphonate 5-triphosphate diphosphatase [Erwinia psidii]|uniref:Alpha-D-ribose 1-methylphosphonate 5-triphosphate diphosphatase n=1 Tax=Erwinia psidii TaxID=69224 RepID=A0A3N6TW53_9GAMM|nr:alpha-D-ribose 1-methylphosphonate 5-triphosphate diphosphatase [Erwinia psidii]MCX8957671.1 alpha-D-ribose 1-methylphosphonate 5-triphosphate diphosphatase [Erwinia psidii]MCX8964028.1 alpha-D-ribose 1-methylphosphonate 5-triphosphate diphosphatase [Erwinia psidii]RQM39512.1 alpha-D-ribose 1-methylphosphonate 5-triphosphate diphosphatase [Erwinia psidii]
MIINNVHMVLQEEVLFGSLEITDGIIRHCSATTSRLPQALDGEGGWLLPGLIELHTDNLDKHFTPRPGVSWPAASAMKNHDAAIISSGITTVLDAVAIGDVRAGGDRLDNVQKMIDAIRYSQQQHLNRAEHFLHLRCELPHPTTQTLFSQLKKTPELRLVSLMDHSPGQRQFVSAEKYRTYYQGKYHLNDGQMDEFTRQQLAFAERWSQPNREAIAAQCRQLGLTLSSHDDATVAHIDDACRSGVVIAEFPTTPEAAQSAQQHGLQVLMGAPNVIRGKSHSGNVSARALAQSGLLTMLSSDYYPGSLLDAVFKLADDETIPCSLPQAVAMASLTPAGALGLDDRGTINEGKRADLVLVRECNGEPHIQRVWSRGRRVF